MAIKVGVWIDHQKAFVVRLTDNGEEIRQIKSNANRPFASAGGPGSMQPDRHTGHLSEDKHERKFMDQLNTYYDEVLKCLSDADSVWILGPGEATGEFRKRLTSQNFSAHLVDLVTADTMTDRQIAASWFLFSELQKHFVDPQSRSKGVRHAARTRRAVGTED